MTNELRGKNRIAPIIIMGIVIAVRGCARHLPAGQRRAGRRRCAVAQDKNGGAAFACRESQTPAGGQIQAFGHAFHCQQHRAHMRTRQDVAGRAQRIGGVPGAQQDQRLRIAAQFQQAARRDRAIFHRLIIGSDPEKRPPFPIERVAGGERRQQRGKAARAPPLREDFMQGAGPQTASQNRICLWMTQGDRWPVGRQAVACQEMAQFRQFCAFVHDMFYNAPTRERVNRNRLFVNHSQSARTLIKLTHT